MRRAIRAGRAGRAARRPLGARGSRPRSTRSPRRRGRERSVKRHDVPRLWGPRVMLAAAAGHRLPGVARGAASRAATGSSRGSRVPSRGRPTRSPTPTRSAPRCSAWDRQRQFDAAYGFGLFLRDDDRFIGEVSLGTVHRGPFQSASIGYWVDRRHAGHGYVPEGVALIIRYGFDDLHLHRLEAAIVPAQRGEPPGRGQARPARGGHVGAVPPDQRRVRGPRAVRDHRRGVAGAAGRVRRAARRPPR